MNHYLVIGLGRFGSAAALELVRLGHSVVGADNNEDMLSRIADSLKYTAIIDAKDEQALKELNVTSYDAVLVAIGDNLESSLLCILHLKNLGVKEIWVKAVSKAHHEIVSKLGVSRIIHPEVEMGIKVAQAMSYPLINKFMSLGKNLYLVDIEIAQGLSGRSIAQVLGRDIRNIKPVLVRREGEIHMPVDANFVLEAEDSLVLTTSLATLNDLAPRLG
ncbi:MAG TPA: TrkA family potassium uptake protein [Thiolinea sp.]|nr:TrkA family potassium uptake protein [Thiolinea sp.]